MTHIEIMENLFFVQRGYLNGNHFVYRSDEPILIDTAYRADYDATDAAIRSLGVDPSRTRLIVNTHCHCDHVGGNKIIQDMSGCDVAMHRIGKHFIHTRDDWSTWWKYYHQEADFFNCTGSLDDGDILSIGPHEFKIIHTPGHSWDGIVLFNELEKVLLSSDTLWEDDMAVMTVRVEGSAACFSMLDSLNKLEALGARKVYPGHGRPFSDVEGAIARSHRKLDGFLSDMRKAGTDLLKKIVVYTILMKRRVNEETFFDELMGTYWFKETVDLYFDGEYRAEYDRIMKRFMLRGIVGRKDGYLYTTVKP